MLFLTILYACLTLELCNIPVCQNCVVSVQMANMATKTVPDPCAATTQHTFQWTNGPCKLEIKRWRGCYSLNSAVGRRMFERGAKAPNVFMGCRQTRRGSSRRFKGEIRRRQIIQYIPMIPICSGLICEAEQQSQDSLVAAWRDKSWSGFIPDEWTSGCDDTRAILCTI